FAGIAFVANIHELQMPNIGDALTLVCALFFAIQVIYISICSPDHDPLLFATAMLIMAALMFMAVAVVGGYLPMLDRPTFLGLLALSLPCTALTQILILYGQRYVTESHAALIYSLEPVAGA